MPKAHELAISLAGLIEDRTFREGQRLPSERELCERFGSARNTIRRALEMLKDEHRIVRPAPRGGYIVDRGAAHRGATSLIGLSTGAGPSDVLELRLIAEPSAAALAAIRATSAELDLLERLAQQTAQARSIAEREAHDAEFHMAIFRSTRNPLLVSLSQSINGVRAGDEWVENKQKILSEQRQCDFDAQHLAIVAALRSRDADRARAAMRAHIDSLRKSLLGEFFA